MDFDLSPDGTGLSGRANQANDIVFVQVTAASLAAAGFGLQQIYELVSGGAEYMDQWRNFVRDLEIEVVASDTVIISRTMRFVYRLMEIRWSGNGSWSYIVFRGWYWFRKLQCSENENAVRRYFGSSLSRQLRIMRMCWSSSLAWMS